MKRCPYCRYGEFRRVNRRGWLEQNVLPKLLGLFPWECVLCRRRKYFRDAGGNPSPRGMLETR